MLSAVPVPGLEKFPHRLVASHGHVRGSKTYLSSEYQIEPRPGQFVCLLVTIEVEPDEKGDSCKP